MFKLRSCTHENTYIIQITVLERSLDLREFSFDFKNSYLFFYYNNTKVDFPSREKCKLFIVSLKE